MVCCCIFYNFSEIFHMKHLALEEVSYCGKKIYNIDIYHVYITGLPTKNQTIKTTINSLNMTIPSLKERNIL